MEEKASSIIKFGAFDNELVKLVYYGIYVVKASCKFFFPRILLVNPA